MGRSDDTMQFYYDEASKAKEQVRVLEQRETRLKKVVQDAKLKVGRVLASRRSIFFGGQITSDLTDVFEELDTVDTLLFCGQGDEDQT